MTVSGEGPAPRAGEVRGSTLLETHLARVLVRLERERATGLLEVDVGDGALRTTFHVREGLVVYAESGTVGETLGRLLVRRGVINAEQYAAILRRMTDALVEDELMRFGEVAIELGVLTPERVSEGLRAQVRERLVRCLQLDRARWIFRDDPDAGAHVARFPWALAAATHDALSEPQEAARWLARLRQLDHLGVALTTEATDVAQRLGLGPAELRMVRALDGRRPIGDVLAPPEPGADARAALIASTLLLELAELREVASSRPSMPPRLSAPDGADEEPSAADATQAAARAVELAERLRQELERRRAAAPPAAQAQRDAARARLSAEHHYDQGRRWLREGKLGPALRDLTAAAEAMPEAAEYRLARYLAEWLLAEDPAMRAIHEDVLRDQIVETLRADKRCALAHYAQGRLLAAGDDAAGAARAFAAAAKLDPSDLEAARWLRLMRQRLSSR